MKRNILFAAAFVLTFAFFFSSNLFGKTGISDTNKTFKENHIKMLLMGINSDNAGLIKSCIHYAGLYKITETVDPLVDILNDKSKDFTTRVSAAMSIYNIGNNAGINAIRVFSESSKEEKIREVCSAIYQDYLDNQEKYLSTNP